MEEAVSVFGNLPDITREPRFRVRVTANKEVAPDVIILSLERPKEFAFKPGQYLWLVLPKRSKQLGIIDRRAYSICSSLNSATLELLIRITGSEYSSEVKTLLEGDEVAIIGPMGSAFVPPPQGALMIAGGTGVSPFLSILRSGTAGKFSLLAYNAQERQSHCAKELQKLSRAYQVILREGNPNGADLAFIGKEADSRPIFISGPQDFVDRVTAILLSLPIAAEKLRYEALYPSNEASKEMHDLFANNKQSGGVLQDFPQLGDLFFLVTRQTTNHAVLTDRNGRILFANHAAEQITGYTFEEMKGQTSRLWGGLMPPPYYAEKVWIPLQQGVAVKRVLTNRRRDGRLYVALATITPISFDGAIIGYIATEEDVTYLKDIDKAKSEFVSLASHQLKTPVGAMRWSLEMLLAGDYGKITPKQRDVLRQVWMMNDRMNELVSSLLNISRIEMGVFVIEPVPTDFVAICKEVLVEMESRRAKKGHTVTKDFEARLPRVSADPKFLRIIFQNLISNAIKYTPANGKIKISLRIDGNNIMCSVANNGAPIPVSDQPRIFEKMFRASNASEQDPSGNGFGLYIVKRIVENAGGRIWFTSKKGEETVFYVTFPLSGMIRREADKKIS